MYDSLRIADQPAACRHLQWLIGVMAILAVTQPGCRRTPPPPPPAPPDLVLITLDTTRADHLGSYGYFRDTSPRLDEFARECLLFENCLVPMATTLPTHLSILTALYPLEHGTLANVRHDGRRFEPSPSLVSYSMVAQTAGYTTAAFVSATPLKRFTGINRGFEVFDEPPETERHAGRTTDAACRWLTDYDSRPERRPLFLWVHYFDPHAPYQPPPPHDIWYETNADLKEHLAARQMIARETSPNEQARKVCDVLNLYDGEVRYMDEQVGRLLDALSARSAWARTIVIIIGDHGEGLWQHGFPDHGYVWHEHLHVPLLIRAPALAPRRLASLLSAVDVLPTVLGLAPTLPRGDFLTQASGQDVLTLRTENPTVFSQRTGRQRTGLDFPTYALTTATWKYVHQQGGEDALYDRQTDPFELRNVLTEHPDMVRALQTTLLERLAEQMERGREIQSDAPAEPEMMSPAELERLRSLGYVS